MLNTEKEREMHSFFFFLLGAVIQEQFGIEDNPIYKDFSNQTKVLMSLDIPPESWPLHFQWFVVQLFKVLGKARPLHQIGYNDSL